MSVATAVTPPSARPVHVAVLDSSQVRRTAISTAAGMHGWRAQPCDRAGSVLTALDLGGVDVVVLNWEDVQRRSDDVDHLFATSDVPMVALADDDDGVKAALRRGAALALRKPCDPEVLMLSVGAMLQQRPLLPVLHHRVTLGDLVVHVANHTVERSGRRQVLSPTEWQLFAYFLAHPDRTFGREQLARGAWGDGFERRRAEIDLYIFRVRRKVERQPRRPVLIETVRNCGYRLTAVPATIAALD
ncbi:MAG TPA: winged helix-turn-helix domain-containing protein [Candidatus Angelobacter sp.]|nr:winged helix-turn-helix domain-containing protein [Candidatus Angelobacter sp.]